MNRELDKQIDEKIYKSSHFLAPGYSSDLKLAIEACRRVGVDMFMSRMPTDPERLAKMALDHWEDKHKPRKN